MIFKSIKSKSDEELLAFNTKPTPCKVPSSEVTYAYGTPFIATSSTFTTVSNVTWYPTDPHTHSFVCYVPATSNATTTTLIDVPEGSVPYRTVLICKLE